MNRFLSQEKEDKTDKRILAQAKMQSNSQRKPALEQTPEKMPEHESGVMLTTAEIIDFADGADSYL